MACPMKRSSKNRSVCTRRELKILFTFALRLIMWFTVRIESSCIYASSKYDCRWKDMVPDNIRAMKPDGYGTCVVTESKGRYYVLRTEHEWDAIHNIKVAHHKSIGRIDPKEGFIPNAYGKQLQKVDAANTSTAETAPEEPTAASKPSHTAAKMKNAAKTDAHKTKNTTRTGTQEKAHKPVPMGCADGYELMLQCSPDVAPAVREYFGDDAPQLLAITLMRLVEQLDTFDLGDKYAGSYASALFPDLDMSKDSVREFLIRVGKREEDIQRFLRSRVTPGEKILVDGTPFFAECVPNEPKKPDPLVHAAYAIDKESLLPEYYMLTNGTVMAPDIVRLAQEAGVNEGLTVLSRRSWTPDAPTQLANAGLQYVVQSNPHEDIQAIEWIRKHGTQGFDVVETDWDFGPSYGRYIPDPKTGGTIRLSIFSDTYANLVSGENPDDMELYSYSLYTNLKDVPVTKLQNELYWLPDTGFQFLALQQTLYSPWVNGGMFSFLAPKKKPDRQMEDIKPGVALSDFLGLLYWQAADGAAADADVPMEFIDILRTARSEEVIDLNHHRMKGTSRTRNRNFKLMGITHAKDKKPDPWGDGKTPSVS